jgi:hypothetical protein
MPGVEPYGRPLGPCSSRLAQLNLSLAVFDLNRLIGLDQAVRRRKFAWPSRQKTGIAHGGDEQCAAPAMRYIGGMP